LLFTGGYGGGGARFAESQVARRYAIRQGIPEEAILIESSSQTTYQNLFEARTLMLEHGLRDAIVVSDPLHMARALRLCRQLGIRAYGSPTPRTRFRSFRTRWEFLARALRMGRQLGRRAFGPPTPRTRFRACRTRWEFRARAVDFSHRDLVVPPQ